MQELDKCPGCQKQYDALRHTPHILLCEHTACQSCLYSNYEKEEVVTCYLCKKFQGDHPQELPKNEVLLNKILGNQNKQSKLNKRIKELKFLQQQVNKIIQEVSQKQTQIFQEIFLLIKEKIFFKSNQFNKLLYKVLEQLVKKIKTLEDYKLIQSNQDPLNEEIMKEDLIQKTQLIIQDDGQKQVQHLSKLRENIIVTLGKLFEHLKNQNFDQSGNLISQTITKQRERSIQSSQPSTNQNSQIETRKSYKSNLIHFFEYDSQNLQVFNIETKQIQKIKIQQQVPYDHRSVDYQNKFYILGGSDNNVVLKTTWKVENDGKCKKLKDMLQARKWFGATVAKGYIYVVGGRNSELQSFNSVERFDLTKQKQWQKCQDFPFGIYNQKLCNDSKECNIFSFGGISQQENVISGILKYNIQNDKWIQLDFKIPVPLNMSAVILQPLIIAGGFEEGNVLSNKIFKQENKK